MTTGERIAELAKQKNMNLHKLAKNAGISYNTLYSIVRRGSDRIDAGLIIRIAKALNVNPVSISESIEQFDLEWAEYELANKGRLFFNFLTQNPLLINILSSAYVDLHMDKEGRIIATYDEYEEKEIFLGDLEKLQELLSESIMKCVKESIGLPLDEEMTTEPSETPTEKEKQEKPSEGQTAPADGEG